MSKITIKLSEDSIKKAIQDLEQYKKDLNRKIEIFTEKLAKRGEKVALQRINESPLRRSITLRSEKKSSETGCKVILIATGEIKQSGDYPPFNTLLAIEFGSGIHYNPVPNPNEADFGLGVGTFPGQTNAFNKDGWWFYDEKKDEWIHSYGVKATMPMYRATVEMINTYKEVAKEVFG